MLHKLSKLGLILLGTFFLTFYGFGQEDLLLRGMAGLERGEYSKSENLFNQILQNHPGNTRVLVQRGISRFKQGKYADATVDFLKVDSLKPGMGALWLARTYTITGNAEKAVHALETHLASPYKKSEKEILMDPVLSKLENTKSWRNLWRKDWYSPAEREKSEILFALSREKYGEALDKLNLLLNQYPEDWQLYFYRAKAYRGHGKQKPVLENLQQALKLNPGNQDILRYRAAFFNTLRKSEEAITDYSTLLKKYPGAFDIYLKRAGIFRDRHEYSKAIRDIKTYLTYFPGDTNAGYLGGVISYEAGRYFDALGFFNPLMEKEMGKKKLYMSRGLTYYRLHTYKQADNDFSMALDLDPEDAAIYFNRGKVRLALENRKKACYDFNKAFKMGDRNALEYLQKYCKY